MVVGGGGVGGAQPVVSKTQSQAQHISMIKCIEDSEVYRALSLCTSIYYGKNVNIFKLFQKALAELLSVITNILIYF